MIFEWDARRNLPSTLPTQERIRSETPKALSAALICVWQVLCRHLRYPPKSSGLWS